MAKIDTIPSRYGDFEVAYSSFNKLFYVGKYPECIKEKPEIKVRDIRELGFKTFDELKIHVKEVVENFSVEYMFIRKVISYKAGTKDYLYFEYFVANESGGVMHKKNKDEYYLEYKVLESSVDRYVGQRNILGQITNDSDNWVIIDYDENIHRFIIEFIQNLNDLKLKLKHFFDKENVVLNILETISNKQNLLSK